MTNPVFERIEGEIKQNPVVLFMKGTPVFPQCGFSARVVQILSLELDRHRRWLRGPGARQAPRRFRPRRDGRPPAWS